MQSAGHLPLVPLVLLCWHARFLQANMWAAGLAASNLFLYAFVYTPSKQIHPINTWVGAVVDAIPPLLGWVAASGHVSLIGMILPAALYFWQIPHFMALAYLCRDDYAAGGMQLVWEPSACESCQLNLKAVHLIPFLLSYFFSLADASGQRTALVALRNCLYLIPLGYLAYDWGITSGWFCLESTLLAFAISGTALSFYQNCTTKSARRMFHASLLYLPVFMSGMMFHQLSDNQQVLGEEDPEGIREHLSSSETLVQEIEIANRQRKVKHADVDAQAHPPVAYASVAPFPFLPAPTYAMP